MRSRAISNPKMATSRTWEPAQNVDIVREGAVTFLPHGGGGKEATAMISIPDVYLDLLLEKRAFAHLATVMPDGSPQNTPVWFDFTGGKIRVNSALGRVKVRNMKLGAKVALSILDPDNPDRYVQLRGTVTRVRQDEVAAAHIDQLERDGLRFGIAGLSEVV